MLFYETCFMHVHSFTCMYMYTDDTWNRFLPLGHSQESLRNTNIEKDTQMVGRMGTWLPKEQLQQSRTLGLKGRRPSDDRELSSKSWSSAMKKREWCCSLLFQETGVQGRQLFDHHPDKLSDNQSCPPMERQSNTLSGCSSTGQGPSVRVTVADVPIFRERLS